jgi:hypothetical protein
MAASYNDPVVANKILARIGDQWRNEVWRSFSYFQSAKHWAKHYRRGREKSDGSPSERTGLP